MSYEFTCESWCVVFVRQHTDYPQMTSNIADEEMARMIASATTERGDTVLGCCEAGELASLLEFNVANHVPLGRADDAFREGAQAMREVIARRFDQSNIGDTAESLRDVWDESFGSDPGLVTGKIPINLFI